ncbi:RNA polymerase [Rhypophila decipiens]|uniref:RNA polymerase II transcription factor B subunit 2 n=1 Tax=Rhypophila decipiens TaxID=261697 RepID=A0AAN7BB63_9PEZI|nr:RNA polymerase [Rhypophila decipiens]
MAYQAEPSYQLSDYLEKLSGATLRKLYLQPSTSFAIFRQILSPLAQSFVQALLCMPGPIPVSKLDVWVRPDSRRARDYALATLRSLSIVQITGHGKGNPNVVQLSTNFQKSLRRALESGGDHRTFGIPSTSPVDAEITIDSLDKYSTKKWEEILHYVVNSVGGLDDGGSTGAHRSGPAPSVKRLLLEGHLVKARPGTNRMGITKPGFTFLLQKTNAQVWTLLLLWLDMAERAERASGSSSPSVDMLSFLFMLASLQLGRPYDADALTEARRNMLPALIDFGLIYINPRMPRQYYPTRLVTTLTSSISPLRSVSSGFSAIAAGTSDDVSSLGGVSKPSSRQEGIIVETNNRIYAYTRSPLQIAVLSLFTNLESYYPGLVSARLTRESIRRAISFGITADQIISYLGSHAHQEMRNFARDRMIAAVLPPTVVDQIKLWQLENDRITATPGFLFKDFENPDEYLAIANYADEVGVSAWRDDARQMFFAKKHEPIRDFMKSRKKASE